MTTKKHFFAVLSAILAVCIGIGLTACSFGPEGKVESALKADINAAKSVKDSDSEGAVFYRSGDIASVENAGLSLKDYAKAVFAHYSYTIDGIEFNTDDPDEATLAYVSMTVTNVNLRSIASDELGTTLAYLLSGSSKDAMSNLIAAMKSSDAPTVTNEIRVTFEKDADGNWTYLNENTFVDIVVLGDQD
jgi:hypothetical protein